MNRKEAEEFKKMFNACSEITGRKFSENIWEMYLKAFERTDFQAIKQVMTEFFKCSKFPTVNDILSRIGEKDISPEESARLLSQRVISAIAKFGWCNEKEAKEHFGSDWEIVTGFQGWGMLCNITNDDLSTFSAQFRNYAEIMLKRRQVDEITKKELLSGDVINFSSRSLVDEQIKRLTAATDISK